MSEGYYDGPGPGYGYAAGPSPVTVVHLLLLILLIVLVLAAAGMAYRNGIAAARRRDEIERARTAGVIYHAIRSPLNGALLATGERVFAPARTVMETIDLYLGPLVALHGGLGTIDKLRKALTTTTKEVKHEAHKEHGKDHAKDHGHAPAAPSTLIFTAPVALAAAGGAFAVSKPAAEAHGAHGAGHAPGHREEHKVEKVELTAKEQIRAVRDALEALSDFWQEDRVKDLISKAQAALLVTDPIGTVGERAAERAAFGRFQMRRAARAPENPVAKAAEEANSGFPLFKFF